MKPLSPVLAALLAALLFYACQKEAHVKLTDDPDTDGSYTGKKVQADFQGRVLTEDGEPVASAQVIAGTSTTFTDQYGVFTLTQVETDEQFGFVKVKKAGYLDGSRTVLTSRNATNFVEIRLLRKLLKGSFDAASSSSVAVEDGVSVSFPDNAIQTASGEAYSGKVNVYAAAINPAAPNFAGIMPGDLRGIRTNNEIAAMISYGMLTVELESETGEKLQLQDGKKASISMTIPDNLLASAPSSIPMWHFDNNKGYWIEEGAGTKMGSTYVGEVAHFSTWNFDVPANFIKLSLQLMRLKGETLAYKEVKVYQEDNDNYYNTALTDSAGNVQMWVPVNTSLKIKVVGACDQSLDSTVIGPFEFDRDLGSVYFNPAPATVVKGKILDCSAAPVADGVVRFYFQGLNYRVPAENGEFLINLDYCLYSGTAKGFIKAESATLLKESGPLEINVTSGVNDVGELKICEDIDTTLTEYVKCTVGAKNYIFNALVDSLSTIPIGQYTNIRFFGANAGPDIYSKTIFLELPDTIPGSYVKDYGSYVTGPDSIAYNTSFSLNYDTDRYRLLLNDTIVWDIIKYGAIGEMIEATFTTKAVPEGNTSSKVPASGTIRIRREK